MIIEPVFTGVHILDDFVPTHHFQNAMDNLTGGLLNAGWTLQAVQDQYDFLTAEAEAQAQLELEQNFARSVETAFDNMYASVGIYLGTTNVQGIIDELNALALDLTNNYLPNKP